MRVLLIEDDSATAQSIELMLKSEGFNVYTTDLGEEGIDLSKIYDYDIILLDLDARGFPAVCDCASRFDRRFHPKASLSRASSTSGSDSLCHHTATAALP
jgi:DNA-binding NarL/FixJ family response regulator